VVSHSIVFHQLDAIAHLNMNWDGYGADAPNPNVLRPREVNRSIDVRSGTITFLPQPSRQFPPVSAASNSNGSKAVSTTKWNWNRTAKFDTFVSITLNGTMDYSPILFVELLPLRQPLFLKKAPKAWWSSFNRRDSFQSA